MKYKVIMELSAEVELETDETDEEIIAWDAFDKFFEGNPQRWDFNYIASEVKKVSDYQEGEE